ncbi:MAG: 3-keto-disaccharide hydrolase [Fimbriimonas sp.]
MQRSLLALGLFALVCAPAAAQTGSSSKVKLGHRPKGFVRLFDGTTLNGWQLVGGTGPGYVPRDGVLVVPSDGGGNLFTEKEYTDFIFRFEFKLTSGGNNGVGLRAPLEGDAAYVGMECQVLDDSAPQYANLLPGQYHGSIYRVFAAKRGHQKPVGEWNREEITVKGRRVIVKLNGKVIVDGNIDDVKDPAILAEHPGLQRKSGHIGFLGHGPSEVQFREIFVRDLGPKRK